MCNGTVTPPFHFVPPLSPPCIHAYVYVGMCELSMVEQRFVLFVKGVLQ